MEKTTYADPRCRMLASNYLPVRVDQDANPDLSSRYRLGLAGHHRVRP